MLISLFDWQTQEHIHTQLMSMEKEYKWPTVANPELFPHQRSGAPGFVQRFYYARGAFLAHRVCDTLFTCTSTPVYLSLYSSHVGVYKRAMRRLRDGHIDTESFSITKAKTHDDSSDILVLTSQVAASLRFTQYTCMIDLFITKKCIIVSFYIL